MTPSPAPPAAGGSADIAVSMAAINEPSADVPDGADSGGPAETTEGTPAASLSPPVHKLSIEELQARLREVNLSDQVSGASGTA